MRSSAARCAAPSAARPAYHSSAPGALGGAPGRQTGLPARMPPPRAAAWAADHSRRTHPPLARRRGWEGRRRGTGEGRGEGERERVQIWGVCVGGVIWRNRGGAVLGRRERAARTVSPVPSA